MSGKGTDCRSAGGEDVRQIVSEPSSTTMNRAATNGAGGSTGEQTVSKTGLEQEKQTKGSEINPHLDNAIVAELSRIALESESQRSPQDSVGKFVPSSANRDLDDSPVATSGRSDGIRNEKERSRPCSPFVTYGREVGVVEETNNALVAHEGIGSSSELRTMNPTFNSAWADLPYVQPRPERRRTREDMEEGRGPTRLRYATALDIRRLSFAWNTNPLRDMSFSHYVDTVKQDEASDIVRFREFSAFNRATALEAWSQLVESRTWWEVPSTIKCDRTFARDTKECYYLDAMQNMLTAVEEPDYRKLPLVQDGLLRRWWNQFRHRGDFLYEEYCRVAHGLLIPYDSFETAHLPPTQLKTIFPQVPDWYLNLKLPAGVPVPLPLSVWYFHTEMCQEPPMGPDWTSQKRRWDRLWQVLKIEYLSLFTALWYSEARWGGRFFILSPSAIQEITGTCSGIEIAPFLSTDEVAGIMRTGLNVDSGLHCSFVSVLPDIPNCTYVECKKDPSCTIDTSAPGRLTTVAETRSRRLRLVIRQTRRIEIRESSPMPLKLWGEDLDVIPGLKEYIVSQRWDANGRMTVRQVLQHLYDAVRYNSRSAGDLTQQLQDAIRQKAEMEDQLEYYGMTPPSQRRRMGSRGVYDARQQNYDGGQNIRFNSYERNYSYANRDRYHLRDPYAHRDPYSQREPYLQADSFAYRDSYGQNNSYYDDRFVSGNRQYS